MKHPEVKSIKVRITAWYALFIVLMFAFVMGVYMVGQHLMSRDYYYDHLKQTVDETVSVVDEKEDLQGIDELTGEDVHIAVSDENGELLYGKNRFSVPFNTRRMRLITTSGETSWYILDARHELTDGTKVWIRCYISSELTKKNIRSLLVSVLVGVPILIVMVVFGGYRLTKRAFRPVDEIIETAENILDTKDLHRRFLLSERRDEVGRLAVTMNEMLARIEKSVQNEKAFISVASHELRTPISVIRAQSEFALGAGRDLEDKNKSLAVILERSRKAGEMLSQMLLLSRMDFQEFPLNMEKICLSELLERLAQEAEQWAEKRNIKIECRTDPGVFLMCDELLIMHAVANLLNNAVKYGRDGGNIWLRLRKTDNGVKITVGDDGIGISKENREKIWDRFYRGENAGSSGSGLGLSIVREIVHAHHGTIDIKSALGVGTEFEIDLPDNR